MVVLENKTKCWRTISHFSVLSEGKVKMIYSFIHSTGREQVLNITLKNNLDLLYNKVTVLIQLTVCSLDIYIYKMLMYCCLTFCSFFVSQSQKSYICLYKTYKSLLKK